MLGLDGALVLLRGTLVEVGAALAKGERRIAHGERSSGEAAPRQLSESLE